MQRLVCLALLLSQGACVYSSTQRSQMGPVDLESETSCTFGACPHCTHFPSTIRLNGVELARDIVDVDVSPDERLAVFSGETTYFVDLQRASVVGTAEGIGDVVAWCSVRGAVIGTEDRWLFALGTDGAFRLVRTPFPVKLGPHAEIATLIRTNPPPDPMRHPFDPEERPEWALYALTESGFVRADTRTFSAYGWVAIDWTGGGPRLAVGRESALPRAFAEGLCDSRQPGRPRVLP